MAKKDSIKPRGQIKLIRKSNKLVEARYKFDIWETRVFIKMISLIKSEDKDFTQYRISVHDIIQEFQLPNNGNYYKLLKEGAEKLLTKQVEMEKIDEDGKKKKVSLNLVSSTESFVDESDGNEIILKFDPELKKHLLDLREQYLTYDVRNILKLTSVHSIRIYELLKQYEGMIGMKGYVQRRFDVEELKTTLGISKDEYQQYGHFKNKVLLKAQKDLLEETDIRFEIEEEKSKRKVMAIIFVIYKNEKNQRRIKAAVEEEKSDPKSHPDFQNVYQRVKEFVTEEVVAVWFSEISINQIKAGVAYSLEQNQEGKVKEMAAYLQTMVRTKTLFHEMEEKSAQEEEKKRKKDLLAKEKETEKQQEILIDKFKKALWVEKTAIILNLFKTEKDLSKNIYEMLQVEVAGDTKNIITHLALDRYLKIAGKSPDHKDVVLLNFDKNGPFSGFVSSTLQTMYADKFEKLKEAFVAKSIELGIDKKVNF